MKDAFFIAKSEIKSIFRDKLLLLALVVIVLLPLFYGFLYLWAFWDPYGNTENIPLAIVNLDKGGIYNDSYYNAGSEIVEKLNENENLSIKLVGLNAAKSGLYSSKYYAIFLIPDNFTKNVLSINDSSISSAVIYYQVRETNNFLASKITKAIADKILLEVNDEISTKYIEEGIVILNKLKDNASNIQEKVDDLNEGLEDLRDGSKKIKSGLSEVDIGAKKLNEGINNSKKGTYSLLESSKYLYSSSLALSSSAEEIYNIFYTLNQKGIVDDSTLNSVSTFSQKNKEFSIGQKKFNDGLSSLYEGMNDLSSGSSNLNSGVEELKEGASKLYRGIDNASEAVSDSRYDLNKGYNTFLEEYNDNRIKSIALQELHPVVMEDLTNESNPNYGTGLAPYFIQLSLWVGGLILLLVISPKDNRLTCSKFSKFSICIGKFILPAIIGTLQAIVLGLVLILILGFSPLNYFLFFIFIILLSLTFISIIQLLIFLFGKAGEIPAILLLMLQLTSSAGTFPIETSPMFFQIINPFLPMSYGMIGLRQIILEGDLSAILLEMGIIFIFLISALFLRILFTKKKLSKFDLRPILDI